MKFHKKLRNPHKFWDFYEHGVTQSLINSYRLCPIQTKLHWFEGWSPRSYNKSFHFGNTIHHALAAAYVDCQSGPPLAGKVISLVKEYEEIWLAEQRPTLGEFTIQQQNTFDEVYILAEAVLLTYFQIYKKDFSKNCLFTERAFNIPYEFPSVTGGTSTTYLRGKIDGAFQSGQYGLELVDHKTKALINIESIKGMIPFDTQCNLYMLAYLKEYGELPNSILYNVIRVPQSKPKRGQSKAEFIEEFRLKVEKEPDHYFYRVRLQIPREELMDWEKNWLVPNLQEIEVWYNSGCTNKTLNPDALETKFGLSAYFQLITTGNTGPYYRRKNVFPELIEDIPPLNPQTPKLRPKNEIPKETAKPVLHGHNITSRPQGNNSGIIQGDL